MRYYLGTAILTLALSVACSTAVAPVEGPPGERGPEGPPGERGPEGPPGTFTGAFVGDVTFAGDAGVVGNLAVSGATQGILPPGMVVAFAGQTPPPGWLLCDGAAYSRSQYAALFAEIGIAHGAGDLVSTFNVPDYRGRFIRGTDRGAGRDPDRANRVAMATGGATGDAVGSVQVSAFASHAHAINDPGHDHVMATYNGNGNREVAGTGSNGWDYADCCGSPTVSRNTTGISVQANGGSETRPVNANANFIIKY